MKKHYQFLLAMLASTSFAFAQGDLQFTPLVYAGNVHVSCNGASDGAVSVQPQVGTAPYAYSWTGPSGFTSIDSAITGLVAGKYVVEVTDGGLNTYTDSIILTQPDVLTSSGAVRTYFGGSNISCNGRNDGFINLTIAGGVAPYNYSWFGPNGFSNAVDEDINNLIPGTYDVTVTDQNGCVTTNSFTLVEPDPVVVTSITSPTYYGGTNTTCFQAGDGSIQMDVIGGSGQYTYLWNGPQGIDATVQDPTNLRAGTYTVTVVDQNGCSTIASITLTAPEALTAASVPFLHSGGYNISCYGEFDGQVTLLPNGGTPPYDYSWTGPNGFTANTKDLANVEGGVYTCLITDSLGCQFSETILLEEPDSLNLTGNVANDVSCFGLADGSIQVNVTGGVPIGSTAPFYEFAWFKDNDPNPFALTGNVSGLDVGTYTLFVMDNNGCVTSATYVIDQPDELLLEAEPIVHANGYNISTAGGSDGSISVTFAAGGVAPYTYSWTGPEGFTSSASSINDLKAGTYTLTMTDDLGCTRMYSVQLTQPDNLSLPVGFSPNGDGINDFFDIPGLDAFPSHTIMVFNRFGNVVYEDKNNPTGWDGNNASGEPLPAGTYFVIVNIDNSASVENDISLKGYLELRR